MLGLKVRKSATTSSPLRHDDKSMKNEQLYITSSLLRKRNIQGFLNSRVFLQHGDCRSIGSLCILFMESLMERGIEVRTVVAIGRDLRSFFEYVEQRHGITTVTAFERRHVEEYATAVCSAYDAGGKTFTDALDANDLLGAVRLFLLYLHASGAVAEDYGSYVPVIPFPDTAEQVQ